MVYDAEVKVLQDLNQDECTGIVKLLDFNETDLVLEYIENSNLHEDLKDNKPFPSEIGKYYFAQLLNIL